MTAKILAPTSENIALLGERLRAGELVAMPTETVYGLAASVWHESALAQVFAVKERPRFDPLICHVAAPSRSTDWLAYLVEQNLVDARVLTNDQFTPARTLAEKFWPGPLTLVLPKTSRVSDLATSGLETLAVRVPRHRTAQALIRAAGAPLCAPSANRFGRISPTCAQDVADELGDRIDWILDGGRCEVGLESTVVAFEESPRILRRGGVSQEEIEAALGHEVSYAPLAKLGSGQLASPGMLASHYAPRKKLLLLPKPFAQLETHELVVAIETLPPSARLGLLLYEGNVQQGRTAWKDRLRGSDFEHALTAVAILSPAGDESEAAKHLFRALRELDANETTSHLIVEPPAKNTGLSAAIFDRLQRAAHRD